MKEYLCGIEKLSMLLTSKGKKMKVKLLVWESKVEF